MTTDPALKATATRTIGENIRDLRVAAGFETQRAFAKALGKEASRVNELEKSRYNRPSAETLELLTHVLGCSMDDLFAGVPRAHISDRVMTRTDTDGLHRVGSKENREGISGNDRQKKSETERNSVDQVRRRGYTSATQNTQPGGHTGAHHDNTAPVGGGDSWKLPADFIALLGIENTSDSEAIKERGHDLIHIATFLRTIGNRLVSGETARPGEGLPSSSPRGRGARGPLSVARPAKKTRGL